MSTVDLVIGLLKCRLEKNDDSASAKKKYVIFTVSTNPIEFISLFKRWMPLFVGIPAEGGTIKNIS